MYPQILHTALFAGAIGLSSAWAQASSAAAEPHVGHGPVFAAPAASTPGDSGTPAPARDSAADTRSPAAAVDHGSMHGGTPPPEARDPHAYSGGYSLGVGAYALPGGRQLRLADEHPFGTFFADRFEAVRGDDDSFTVYDVLAWYGRDYDRLWFKSDGEVNGGRLENARSELLWGHAIAAYWDTQLGVRYDSGEGPNRSWLAFGVQGLAPYWFEVEASAYLGEQGRTALRLEAEYELLFTQRLILQPRLEASFYGRRDAERQRGSGLSSLEVGLRLRYEIRRELAPYLGVERVARYGETADLVRAANEDPKTTRLVAGVRFWF